MSWPSTVTTTASWPSRPASTEATNRGLVPLADAQELGLRGLLTLLVRTAAGAG